LNLLRAEISGWSVAVLTGKRCIEVDIFGQVVDVHTAAPRRPGGVDLLFSLAPECAAKSAQNAHRETSYPPGQEAQDQKNTNRHQAADHRDQRTYRQQEW
jgi:hypothetical protein